MTAAESTAPSSFSDRPLWQHSASEIASAVRAGNVSATAVLESCLARIAEVEPGLGALVWPMFDRARKTAERIDRWQAAGDPLGPLAGVPISIKECYLVRDTPATIGLTARRNRLDPEDGLFVRRLIGAGAVPVGKTNVPLLMIYPESHNPLYGATNHPLDRSRSPGGSSGGEAALIASGGTIAGLANDLGGSIRVPASLCGLVGFKPTGGRLPRTGAVSNLAGLETLIWQAGPITRTVADCETFVRVLAGEDVASAPPGGRAADAPTEEAVATRADRKARIPADEAPWDSAGGWPGRSSDVDLASIRLGVFDDDGYFPVHAAGQRAVREAAAILRQAGVTVVPYRPRATRAMLMHYVGLMSADGGAGLARWLEGSRSNSVITRLRVLGRVPGRLRGPFSHLVRSLGRGFEADLIRWARSQSADGARQLTAGLADYRRTTQAAWDDAGLDGLIGPTYAVPAMPHGLSGDLIPAGSVAFLANALGGPAGTVPVTRVTPEDAATDRDAWTARGQDALVRRAGQAMADAAGLPVGVQVIGRPWQEDVVLAVMAAIEQGVTLPATWERDVSPTRAPAPHPA